MKLGLIALVLTTLFSTVHAQEQPEVRARHFNLEKGVAISGYDPVAYFKQGRAVKGRNIFSHTHQGVTYYFASAQDRDDFQRNPSAFEPQYGGWCAYAMGAKGEKVSIDPATFKIVSNKLFLFYHSLFNNTLTSWNRDEANLKAKADRYWTDLVNK